MYILMKRYITSGIGILRCMHKKIYTANSFYESLDRNGACYLPRKSKSCGTIFCSKCEPESMLKLSSNSKTLSIKLAVLDNLRATEK